MPNSNTMKKLRNETGFTQKELAELTGISPATISLFEKGRRNLPISATIKLGKIKALQAQFSRGKIINDGIVPQSEEQKQKLEKFLKSDIRKAANDAVRLSLTLSRMQERYQGLYSKLNFIKLLKQEALPATREMTLLEWMELDILDKMKKCSPVRQAATRYQLMQCDSKKQAAWEVQAALKKIH